MKALNASTASISENPVFLLNILLLAVGALLLFYYIIQANMMAADSYKIRIFSDRLNSLNETNSFLAARKSATEDVSRVIEFAKNQNMVEAKDVNYLFEDGKVALQR